VLVIVGVIDGVGVGVAVGVGLGEALGGIPKQTVTPSIISFLVIPTYNGVSSVEPV
jgi:hypothetical protein